MRILQMIIVFFFLSKLYSSNNINNVYMDVNHTIYERFKTHEYNNIYKGKLDASKKEFLIKSKLNKTKDNVMVFLTKLSLFYENEDFIIFFLKNYNKNIAVFYEFVFKNHKINALKTLIKYSKYSYNDSLFHYKILLYNNKTSWKDKLLDNEYLYASSFFRFSSLGYLIDKCNSKMIKVAMSNGIDKKANSSLLDLSIIKRCKKISLFLSKEGLKGDLLLHIMRNDYYGVSFIINHKVLNKNINEIKKIEILNENLKVIKVFNNTVLDYAIYIGNKNIIIFLRKHGAKRACEILKTKCRDIKIENTKGDK